VKWRSRTRMDEMKKNVALESRLRNCNNVMTLGVRPNFDDYSPAEKRLILDSEKIYYPSACYADLLEVMGKEIFPSSNTYRFAQDKIKQTALFNLLGIPTPKTKVFYGKAKNDKIIKEFPYPFIGKIPRGSALGRGVFLVRNRKELDEYCQSTAVAYIQEYLPIDRDIRIVIIGDRFSHAYWRVPRTGEFRCNVAIGARIEFDNIPQGAMDLAKETARRCRWNDVGIDLCVFGGKIYVIEANMKYGREGFRQANIDYTRLMERLISEGGI
jgi:ribosomal protein S6--L-glutamate ligase